MNKNWYPNDYVESTYKIDFAELAKEGYSAVIFDVDNTLVPHGAPADDRAKELFQLLNANGFSCMLLSNNKEPRVKSFAEDVKYTSYIYKANKPSSTGYKKAMEQMGSNENNTIFVGDQILTDVWGARRAGIRTIMVKPVLKWKEEPQIVLKRFVEAIILFFYKIYKKHGDIIIETPLI